MALPRHLVLCLVSKALQQKRNIWQTPLASQDRTGMG